jgi:predicted RNase H-like nuclease (RuvC/YqgF family)
MKKILIISSLFLVSSHTVFAYVNPVGCGTEGNCVSKNNKVLTTDVSDLQNQIDQLNKKNLDLEYKISELGKNKQATNQTQVIYSESATQTQKINELENRVEISESLIKGLKNTLDKTIGLLTKLLDLIK